MRFAPTVLGPFQRQTDYNLGSSSHPWWVSRTLSGVEGEPNPILVNSPILVHPPIPNILVQNHPIESGRLRFAPPVLGPFRRQIDYNLGPSSHPRWVSRTLSVVEGEPNLILVHSPILVQPPTPNILVKPTKHHP